MTRRPRFIAALVAAAAVARLLAAGNQAQAPPIADRDLGLRTAALADDPLPPLATYATAAPGESSRLAPAFLGAPPLIPHAMDGIDNIAVADNACLMCHHGGGTDPGDPPQVPKSHMVDLRNPPATVRESVAGARWVCTSCHVPQTDAAPLVGNHFGR